MDIVTISIVLGFTAGAVQLYGYWVYNKGAGEKINTGSWSAGCSRISRWGMAAPPG